MLLGVINMKIAVCDDEKEMRASLLEILNEYASKRNIIINATEFSCGSELLRSKIEFDIIFMDYQMDGLDGMETSRRYRTKENTDTTLIFVSAFPLIALDSFEVNTFRFLTKPIDKNKLFKALDDYLVASDDDKLIHLKSGDDYYKVNTDDIIYAEAERKHTIIRTTSDTIVVSKTLHEIEVLLPSDKFYRCQKSFVVNFRHISNHNNSEIFFDNGEKASISRRLTAEFKSAFRDYIMRYNMEML